MNISNKTRESCIRAIDRAIALRAHELGEDAIEDFSLARAELTNVTATDAMDGPSVMMAPKP